ncbi:sodium/hydrogen exchanger 9B1 [Drosophila busckii]|uniref:sodium/hydrogen exchanger 9B1 n=1 Tax=Drosophila busckii TaxID=30019 RepID=UPI00083EDE10|nr:sodium/hydrogen exchanger 9B1 [Drosophila busckii]
MSSAAANNLSSIEEQSSQSSAASGSSQVSKQVETNEIPLQLLRRASETVTASILQYVEPETELLLSKQNPQPPPRSCQRQAGSVQGKRGRQQQLQQSNNTLLHGDNMTQCDDNNMPATAAATHTKLDTQQQQQQKLSPGHNRAASDDESATTIILTPTSLNLTNTTPNAPPTAGNSNNNGGVYGAELQYKGPKWWRVLVLHWPLVSEHVALLAIFLALWAMLYIVLPNYAAPDTVIMRIVLLFVGAQIMGLMVTFLSLPDMLGMLLFGVVYGNVGLAYFEGYGMFEKLLRELALINIMLLAGLGLDGSAFRRLWLMILRLTLLPTIVEVAVIAVLAYFTLSLPWLWGIALGLVITAVSPNVVVTVMLKLKEERLGLNNGIHTLIYAMTACNDVVSIFMFGVIVSVIYSTSSLTQQMLQGPIGIGIGLVFGYLYGMLLQYLPSRNAVYVNGLRFVLTVLGGTIAVMGSRVIGYTSAGALGCVMLAFIGNMGWKREELKMTPAQLQAQQISGVAKRLDLLWKFLKPVSFSLIGKEINFDILDGRVIGYGVLLVLFGCLFRLAFAYLSTYGGNLSRKERAYITISGFPKATVQAALGPVALDMARDLKLLPETALASNVLIISVLAIIFTAPLGAILMLRLAPLWLKHDDAAAPHCAAEQQQQLPTILTDCSATINATKSN